MRIADWIIARTLAVVPPVPEGGSADPVARQLRYEVATDIVGLEDTWRRFEKIAVSTAYQSYAYMAAWCRAACEAQGERPIFLLAYDEDGLAFLWPLAMVRQFGATTLTWLAQSHGSYFFGLYRPDVPARIDAAQLREAFEQIRAAFPEVVAVTLEAQPESHEGVANPMLALPRTPYPVPVYQMSLEPDVDALVERKLDRKARSDLRRKRRIFSESGATIEFAETTDDRLAIHEALVAQKSEQLASMGVPRAFLTTALDAFYRELARSQDGHLTMMHACVRLGPKIVATNVGFACRGHFTGLQLSMDASELSRASPGQLLLIECMRRQGAAGVSVFDFGPGEGRHKSDWGCTTVPRFATSLALTSRGTFTSLAHRAHAEAKDLAKRNPQLHRLAKSLRRRSSPLGAANSRESQA